MDYQAIYNEFVTRLVKGEQVEAAETGKTIVLLAHAYGTLAGALPALERKVNLLMATTIQSNDKDTGKPMTATKAEVLVRASDDYNVLNITKANLETVESYINALKAMAKAQTGEMQNAGR